MSIETMVPSNLLILCLPLLLLPSVFPSIRVVRKKKKKESFPVSQLFILVLELHLQHQSFRWIFRVDFLLGLTGLISLLFRGLSRIFASTTVQKHKFFSAQPFMVQLSHPYMTTGKTNSFNYMNLYSKVMSLLFNMLSRLVILVIKKKLVTHSCLTLWNPLDCSLPGFSVHGILQIRILEWVAFPFSRGSSWPRDWTLVSHVAGRFFTTWATRKATLVIQDMQI